MFIKLFERWKELKKRDDFIVVNILCYTLAINNSSQFFCMEARPKSTKSSVRRRPSSAKLMAAASSPAPSSMNAFNTCGHDGCNSGGCNVRYVGPVSHLRDHHALHAARGVTHVWTAAIVSGLAVVVTGVLAYNAAQAREIPTPRGSSAEMRVIMERLDRMEAMMRDVADRCSPPPMDDQQDGNAPTDQSGTSPEVKKNIPPPPAQDGAGSGSTAGSQP